MLGSTTRTMPIYPPSTWMTYDSVRGFVTAAAHKSKTGDPAESR